MALRGNDVDTDEVASKVGDNEKRDVIDARAFRRKFAIGAAGLLLIYLFAGFAAWFIQSEVAAHAVAIYDRAFVSNNYIHIAELKFRDFVDDARRRDPDAASAKERLGEVADALGVAAERASTPTSRQRRLDASARIAELADYANYSADAFAARTQDAEEAMAALAREASAEGLKARDDIADYSRRGEWLLIALALTAATIAAGGLTALHALVQRITRMANFDALTGLPKRSALHARLSELLRARRASDAGFAVMSLDLDRFKAVNDTLGHGVGDRLLVQVGQRINSALGANDEVARFGGDEFVIVNADFDNAKSAGELAERLIALVGAPYVIDNQQVLIGASVGVALAPENGEDADELIRNSDIALYRAKADGKGCFRYFAEEMNAAMQRRRTLEIELRAALENGKLDVHYQPLVEVSTGIVGACEALVRWRKDDGDYVPPNEFIPLCEENGLIVPLSKYVLRRACADASSWTRDIRVAVNLSAAQFRVGDLVAIVREVLGETGLPAERLEFEVTESVLIEAKDEVLATLRALRAMGVHVSLDDFGTGYSSLAYLSCFPFDKIKVDRTFIREIEQRSDAGAIVKAIAGLAVSLGMNTTAEGVERVEELDWLREAGITEIQGYLFSRAISARDIRALLGMGEAPPVKRSALEASWRALGQREAS